MINYTLGCSCKMIVLQLQTQVFYRAFSTPFQKKLDPFPFLAAL